MPYRRLGEPFRGLGKSGFLESGLGSPGGGGAAGVTPLDDAGLFAWLDMSDITTLWKDTARTSQIDAGGQDIKGITDLSGVGNHFQTILGGAGFTYQTGVQNGLSIGRGPGTVGLVSAASVSHGIGTGEFWVVAAFIRRGTGTAGYKAISSFGTYAPAWYYVKTGTDINNIYWGSSLNFNKTFVQNSSYLAEFGRESGTLKSFVNGTQEAATHALATSIANGTIQVFAERATGGAIAVADLCEICWYKPKPSDDFLVSLRSYFNSKWGLY